MKKKLISLLAALALIVTLLPVTAMAAVDAKLEAMTARDGKSIMLDWDDDNLRAPYRVQRKVAGGTYSTIESGLYSDEYVDDSDDLDLGKVYYYRIKDSNGTYSVAVPAKTMVAPSYVKVTVTGTIVKLSWPAGKYCDGYAVFDVDEFDDIDAEDLLEDLKAETTETFCTLKNVNMNRLHVFMVMPVAVLSSGAGCIGEPVVGLETPQVTLSKSDGKVKLSWDPVQFADKYEIYRSTDGKTFGRYASTTKTSWTNSKVTSGTKYYYKVKAVCLPDEQFYDQPYNQPYNQTYYSAASAVRSTIPLTTPVVTAKLSSGSVKLSWEAVKGATKYLVYRSTDGKSFTKYSSTGKTSWTNSSVTEGKTYYYKVKAIKTVGTTDYASSYSAVKSVKVLKTPVISLSKTNGTVKLSWAAVDGAAKYYVYRSTDGKTFSRYASTTKTSWTNSKVTSGTKYYYKVRAVDANGGTGKLSAAKSTIPLTTPQVTAVVTDSGAVKLSWGAVTGATKYYVYRSTDGESFNRYSSSKTSWINSKVTAGQTYYYKVKAIKVVGTTEYASSYSAVMTVVTPVK